MIECRDLMQQLVLGFRFSLFEPDMEQLETIDCFRMTIWNPECCLVILHYTSSHQEVEDRCLVL